jgi:hypothetical protein
MGKSTGKGETRETSDYNRAGGGAVSMGQRRSPVFFWNWTSCTLPVSGASCFRQGLFLATEDTENTEE